MDALRERGLLTEEIIHLEQLFKLDGLHPLHGLWVWHPTDPADRLVKRFLLDFAAKVVLHERRRVAALASESGAKAVAKSGAKSGAKSHARSRRGPRRAGRTQ